MTGSPSGERSLASLRIGFAGTPPFAAAALGAILAAGGRVQLVLTQPDRPSGRGMTVAPSAVKALALAHGLPVLQPPTLKTDDARAPLLAVDIDVLVVAAYGLILPPAVLAWPRYGCLNIHASLLPRWRGAAPVQHAILAGDATSGVTIMQMDAGLDTGAMIHTVPVALAPRETGGTLLLRLTAAGADAIVAVLGRLAAEGRLDSTPQPAEGRLDSTPQPAEGATYAGKIGRTDARLDWTRPAVTLDRVVRAFDPVPGAATALATEAVKVWQAQPVPGTAVPGGDAAPVPGTVLAVGPEGIDVACGEGALRLVTLQPAGGKRMSAAAFAAGRALAPGARFDAPA